jgi:monoamine oxidase
LGGRLKNAAGLGAVGLPSVDMGAAWCWPAQQPKIRALLRELNLATFEQPDDGGGGTHRVAGGTFALVAALAAQVAARGELRLGWPLAACALVPPSQEKRAGASLIRLTNQAGEVCSLFFFLTLPALARALVGATTGRSTRVYFLADHFLACMQVVLARAAVLAVPPKLLAERVAFEPPLDPARATAMRESRTWMVKSAPHGVAFPVLLSQHESEFVS